MAACPGGSVGFKKTSDNKPQCS